MKYLENVQNDESPLHLGSFSKKRFENLSEAWMGGLAKLVFTVVVLSFSMTLRGASDESVSGHSVLSVGSVDKDLPEVLKRSFNRQITVFGVRVLATEKTPEPKMLHAANVLAQYLDNDEDGNPDNPRVIQAMQRNKATLVMFATQRESSRLFRVIEKKGADVFRSMTLQDLYGEETHPGGAARGVFDAAYEEVLHLITHAGYASAYPEVFGEKPGTQLGDAMDKARGGRFMKIPRRYPKSAWYSYDDETCDYGCQATEYIYWGLTSLLGAQSFEGRAERIEHEWRLSTPKAFEAGDVLLYKLLTDDQYSFPSRLPDGTYQRRP